MNYKDNIIEDEIISIEEFGIIDTIDIEVESKDRLFFANDILTHNSGWEANDLSITSIAESAGLLHTVDILFGIITTAEMKAGGEYFLKCLANRVAGYENMRQRFTVEWKYARIEQDRNSPMQDMDFFINQITTKHNHSQSFQSRTNVVNAKDIIKQDEQIKDPVPTDTDSLENKITKITGDGLF